MEIRWANVVAFVFLITALVIFVMNADAIASFLATIKDIGPNHSPEQQLRGLLAFGLIGVIIVAVVRIVVANNRNDN